MRKKTKTPLKYKTVVNSKTPFTGLCNIKIGTRQEVISLKATELDMTNYSGPPNTTSIQLPKILRITQYDQYTTTKNTQDHPMRPE